MMDVELIWAKRLLERLRQEGTSIVLASTVSQKELHRAIVEGRSFNDADGRYVVTRKRAVPPSALDTAKSILAEVRAADDPEKALATFISGVRDAAFEVAEEDCSDHLTRLSEELRAMATRGRS